MIVFMLQLNGVYRHRKFVVHLQPIAVWILEKNLPDAIGPHMYHTPIFAGIAISYTIVCELF